MRTFVEVDGRRIAVYCAGTGGPPIVFLPGAGLVGLEYRNVLLGAAELTTAITYDRAGTGWSDPVPLPRSAAAVATELRAVLPDEPVVLAGHSMGAVYARRFAQLFPSGVAGLLLIDPGHEDLLSALPAEVVAMNETFKASFSDPPELSDEQRSAAAEALRRLYAAWPGDVREELVAHRLAHWRTGLAEGSNLETEVYAELRDGGPVPDVPTIVLSAGEHNPLWAKVMPPDLLERAHAGVLALHATLGEQRLVAGASHQYLHVQQPAPVLAAVRDLLARVVPV